jgi:hypothetical protein
MRNLISDMEATHEVEVKEPLTVSVGNQRSGGNINVKKSVLL